VREHNKCVLESKKADVKQKAAAAPCQGMGYPIRSSFGYHDTGKWLLVAFLKGMKKI
jgi:hypothetical protein